MYKKWSFPLGISSLNVTKSTGNCGFGHIYWRNPYNRKVHFLCSDNNDDSNDDDNDNSDVGCDNCNDDDQALNAPITWHLSREGFYIFFLYN